MTPLILFFCSLFFTFVFTPNLINFYKRNGILDKPGGRKIHINIVPSMGGVLIAVIGILVLSLYANHYEGFIYLMLSFLIITACGIFDDLFDIVCAKKFFIQNISSIFLIIFFSNYFNELILFGIELPAIASYILLHLFIVGSLNAINLLDGLDGLVSGISLIILSIILGIAVITSNILLLALSASLIGGLIGFLRYNSYPATIFLGDTGSLVLGFFLIFCSITASLSLTPRSLDLTLPVILLALPIIDCIKVFIIRILKKKNPFSADHNHIHYVITRLGVPHKFSVFFLEMISLIFIFLSLMYIRGMHSEVTFFFALMSVFILFIKQFLNTYKYLRRFARGIETRIDTMNYKFRNLNRNFMIIFGSIFTIRIIFLLPTNSVLNQIDVLFFILLTVIYMLITITRQRLSKINFEANVFFNLTFFFLIGAFGANGKVISIDQVTLLSGFPSILIYGGGISFIYMLIKKGSNKLKDEGLLSGIDLSLMTLILAVNISNYIFDFESIAILSNILIEAFAFYLGFKVFVRINNNDSLPLVSFSFLLPLISLGILFFLS